MTNDAPSNEQAQLHGTPPPQQRTYYAEWGSVFILMALYTSSFIDRAILGLLVGPIRQDLQISDTGVSLLQGFAFALFYTALGLPAGRLADSGSRKKLIAYGAALWSLATAACGAAANFTQLFWARAAVGVGEATLTPAAHSLIADLFPREMRAKAFSVYQIGISLGQGLGLLIGGTLLIAIEKMGEVSAPVLGTIKPWQLVFFAVGLPGLLLALLAMALKEPPRSTQAKDVPTLREAIAFMSLHKRAFGCWIGAVSLYAVVTFGYPAWMPTVFVRKHGMSAGDVGAIYGILVLVAGPIGMLSAGAIADYLFRRGYADAHWRVIIGIGLLALPVAVAAPLVDDRNLAFALVAIQVFLMNTGGVNGAALTMAALPRLRGQITAVNFFFAAIMGFGIGPTAIALLTDQVYGNDLAVGQSLATACAIVFPLAFILLRFARKPMMDLIQAQKNN